MKTMRDAFFDNLYKIAKKDRDIILVCADMGAPSLDKFRRDLSSQFLNIGIAEQNMITVSSGLALSGKNVFAHAIMPFITLRCYEQIKIDMCAMNVPITTVGVGAGFSYDDSGPTHHATEDIAIMRCLPNITILNVTDNVMASACAEIAYRFDSPLYIRLDREPFQVLYKKNEDFSKGVSCLREGKDLCIIATGNMVHKALEVANILEKYSIKVAVVDLYRLKPINVKKLIEFIEQSEKILTLEENLINGGVGSIIAEVLVDNNIIIPLKRIAIPDKYCYTYGGRECIRKTIDLDSISVERTILKLFGLERR